MDQKYKTKEKKKIPHKEKLPLKKIEIKKKEKKEKKKDFDSDYDILRRLAPLTTTIGKGFSGSSPQKNILKSNQRLEEFVIDEAEKIIPNKREEEETKDVKYSEEKDNKASYNSKRSESPEDVRYSEQSSMNIFQSFQFREEEKRTSNYSTIEMQKRLLGISVEEETGGKKIREERLNQYESIKKKDEGITYN